MSSKLIKKSTDNKTVSRLVRAMDEMTSKIEDFNVKGQFGQVVIFETDNVKIKNSELDCEFEIPFDDDTEANEATLTVYNLSSTTIKKIVKGNKITVTAGYNTDTGIIFSGFISHKRTYWSGGDKVTKIYALDDMRLKERNIKSITFAKGTKASKILKKLCTLTGLTIACFSIERDFTYKDEETINGGLMSNIERLAGICGVSAYIHKSKVYVRSLAKGDKSKFILNSDTGLMSVESFEESETNGDYKDTIKGYDLQMLLQHKIQTATILTIDGQAIKGTYRVASGTHSYNGTEMITQVKVIKSIDSKKKVKKKKKTKKKK